MLFQVYKEKTTSVINGISGLRNMELLVRNMYGI